MSAVVAPGKFAAVKMLVAPVMMGSPVATAKVMPGMNWVPLLELVQVLTSVKLPPKLNWWAPLSQMKLALPCFNGLLRRVWPVVRKGLLAELKLGAKPRHCAQSEA